MTIESDLKIPFADQYVGVWAMHEPVFAALVDQAKRLDLVSHLASDHVAKVIEEVSMERNRGGASGQYRTTVEDGVAVIRVTGTLMKQASSFGGGSSTVMLRKSLLAAMRDDDVRSILLAIESPGGTAAGTFELAETIALVNSVKPVHAHIEDLGASAAYWIASQTASISSNEPGKIGSIGTYAVINDFSAMAAKDGVKVHVIRAGSEHKGAGVPGTEVTASQLAEFQKMVNAVNDFFVRGVAKGRGMSLSQIEALADGRIHVASVAKEHGLIDHIRTYEQSFSAAAASASRKTTVRGSQMSDTKIESAAATAQQIEASCPGAKSDFILNSLKAGRTLDQCRDAFIQDLATDLAAANERIASLSTELAEVKHAKEASEAKLTAASSGVDPLIDKKSGKTEPADNASDVFWSAVKDQEAKGMSRARAMAAVNRKFPELRAAMLAEASRN